MLVAIRENVAALKKQGRSRDETVAAKPTAAFDAKWGNFVIDPGFFTRLVYESRVIARRINDTFDKETSMKADRAANTLPAVDRRKVFSWPSGACRGRCVGAWRTRCDLFPELRPASIPVTHYRTKKVDGVKIFYREAGPENGPSCCCCTAFRPRRICSAT